MAGARRWTATIGALTVCASGVLAGLAMPNLAVPSLAGNPQPSQAEADIELRTITRQLDHAREQEQAMAGKLTALEAESAAVSRSLAETAARIQSREAMVTAGEEQLQQIEAEEQDLLAGLSQRQVALSELLAGLQRLESNPPPPFVTRPDDALSALRGAMLFGAIVPALEAETTALSGQLARIENLRASRRDQQRELTRHLDRLAAARAELKDLQARKLKLMDEARGRLEAERLRTQGLAARATSLRQLLSELTEQRQREQAEQHSAAEEQERRRLALLNRPQIAFTAKRGQTDFPAQGQRLREFGDRDGFGGHSKGLYIATRKLAQVTAPADGEIEFAGEFRSYGRLLILNVGEGYHVLLAGLGVITAEAGQALRAGEPVGAMGEAPARGTLIGDRLDDPRPILYIEFRKDGSAIDPSDWWIGSRKEASR
ncbi:MAG TPA: peptidoglycan DD-metalloendopeptidase family protein [Aestuariivirgaceae bacterium]|nr:peptidoglycan DD-metalloendopeptidase family protein [Aestuariivirgaceae bacterium]